MTGTQYNSVVRWTLANIDAETANDNLAAARAVMNNCGVAFPNGNILEVMFTLMSEKYMGWESCTYKQAQEYANTGIAAVGIDGERVVIILPEDSVVKRRCTELEGNAAEYVKQADRFSISERMPMQFFAYAGAATTTTDKNRDYRGLPILSQNELALVNSNKRFYQNAGNQYGVPWRIIAAIHYREYRFKKAGPSNGNGPYQIWGSSYPIGDYTDEQFQHATNEAAKFIKGKVGNRDLYAVNNIKYAFFAYNGMASSYKNQAKNLGFNDAQANIGEGSPYVMNRADARRDPTIEPTKSNNTWGQIKSDGGSLIYPANTDYGAYIVCKSL